MHFFLTIVSSLVFNPIKNFRGARAKTDQSQWTSGQNQFIFENGDHEGKNSKTFFHSRDL